MLLREGNLRSAASVKAGEIRADTGQNIPRGKGIERDTRADNPFIDTVSRLMLDFGLPPLTSNSTDTKDSRPSTS